MGLHKRGAAAIMGAMLRPNNGEDYLDSARERMLEEHLRGRGITDQAVLRVMAAIPREPFVPEEFRHQAYTDGPLPIGAGQTISQPYIVALMTQLLRVDAESEVLEVGTGSGYQTAVLARLAKRVYTIERLPELSTAARHILDGLGIHNVEFYLGDGSCGWPEPRTFECILITAAVPDFPQPLVGQLQEAGAIVAPIGRESVQQLTLAEKYQGKLVEKTICSCRFVRLIGQYGFPE
jgi:protein-L-isoaspartate(D-aspartate) O-methyltransferase